MGRVFGSWQELHHMHYMHGQIPLKKGDSCSKIAKVSTLVLLYAVARGVKEKERIRFIVNSLLRCKQIL